MGSQKETRHRLKHIDDVMAENSPNLAKETVAQVHITQSQQETKGPIPGEKCQKVKTRILKALRGKQLVVCEGFPHGTI